MQATDSYNPIAITVYFAAVIGICAFTLDPIFIATSLVFSVFLFNLRSRVGCAMGSQSVYLLIFVLSAIINPIVSHNGKTVLFLINDTPITLEACIFGLVASGALTSVLYWFRIFTDIMTDDKLLYVFGKISPKLSLILSMGLRYVSMLSVQIKKIRASQTALGLYKDDNIIDRIRGELRVFSALVSWALENGIVTADSMAARGYGIGKRSHFSIFSFTRRDVALVSVSLIALAVVLSSVLTGGAEFAFYPTVSMEVTNALGIAGYIAYGILCALPIIIETEDSLKWKYLRSRI